MGGQTKLAHPKGMKEALWVAVVWLPTLCWAQSIVTESADAPILLRDGHAVSASQRADQQKNYVFEATAGQNYLIQVEQQGLDFIVTVTSPDGDSRSFNSPLLRDEREFVLLDDTVAGEYAITVHSEEHTGAIGLHSVQLANVDPSSAGKKIDAWRLMSRGAAANFESGEEAWAASVTSYEAAAHIWESLGEIKEFAAAKYALAMIEYWHLKNRERSSELAAQASELYSSIDESAVAANAMHLQAASLIETAEEAPEPQVVFDAALALFEQSASIQEKLGDVYGLAHTVNNIGLTYYYMGDWTHAREYWQQAAQLFRNVDEWSGELYPLANVAVIDAEEGYLTSAIDSLQRVLELLPEGKNLRHRVDTLGNLGGAQRMFGNFDAALEAFSSALAVANDIEDVWGIGWALAGIGETYYSMGELELAEEYLRSSLPKERQAGDERGEADVLRYLGGIEHIRGDYAAAFQLHEQALALATSPPDRALVQLLMSRDLAALGRYQEAREVAEEALAVAINTNNDLLTADALHGLGMAYLHAGDTGEALATLERGREIYESLAMHTELAGTLNGLALTARAMHELDDAVRYGEASLASIERVRGRVADPELRAFYLSARRDYYELQIDLLMALYEQSEDAKYVRAALTMSERARARMLVDLMHEAAIDLDVDPEIGARQRELYGRLAERRRQQDILLETSTNDSESHERLAIVLGELAQIENELNVLETESRRQNPRLAAVTAPQTLAAADVQQALDADSVLVQYALGAENSFAWVVTSETLIAVRLCERRTIETLAARAFEDLKNYNPDSAAIIRLNQSLNQLAEVLLVPVAAYLDKERILIAADGALHYIPFGVLPVRQSEERLLENHEVVMIPSMSVLAAQRSIARQSLPTKQVAIFADPVFEVADARLQGRQYVSAVQPTETAEFHTRAALRSTRSLTRLPLTAQEARSIAELVPPDQRFIAMGFEASRRTALNTALSDYRIVHFATHGLVDSRYPDLSALALSRFDVAGTARDGFLELHDIYDLKLNADLVVLSACETALGREIRGEGLVGFTQGFMYAGAKAVVATLWQVPDRATAELMTRFYGYVLTDGLRPADALRRAQISISGERRWSHPYFWAAFIILGDWQ